MNRKGSARKMKRSEEPRTPAPPRKRTRDELIECAQSSAEETAQPRKRVRSMTQDNAIFAKQQERNRELEELLFGPPEEPAPSKEPAHPPQPPTFTLFLSLPREIRDMIYRYTLESGAMSASLRQPSLSELTSRLDGLDDFLQHQLNLAGCSHHLQQKAFGLRGQRQREIEQQIQELPPLFDLSLFRVNKQVSQEAMAVFYAHTLVRLKVSDRDLTDLDKGILRQASHLLIKYEWDDQKALRAPWGTSLRQILEPRTNIRSFIFQGPWSGRLKWSGVKRILGELPRVAVKNGSLIWWLYEGSIQYLTSRDSRWQGKWHEYSELTARLETRPNKVFPSLGLPSLA